MNWSGCGFHGDTFTSCSNTDALEALSGWGWVPFALFGVSVVALFVAYLLWERGQK